jgi:hypothetical protein
MGFFGEGFKTTLNTLAIKKGGGKCFSSNWHDIFHMFDKVLMHVIARLPPSPTTFDTQFGVQYC